MKGPLGLCFSGLMISRECAVFHCDLLCVGELAIMGSNSCRPIMRPSVALNLKRAAVREAAGRFRTVNPRVFGSVLHGTDQDGSDLDLLVDALPGATMFDLGGLQVELEELLGVGVDLLTPGDLPPKFRHVVLAEAAPV